MWAHFGPLICGVGTAHACTASIQSHGSVKDGKLGFLVGAEAQFGVAVAAMEN